MRETFVYNAPTFLDELNDPDALEFDLDAYELSGAGDPVVLVHGSWGDHHNWDPVIGALAGSFRVLSYDRRGHSRSERPARQGSVLEDADDLAAKTIACTGDRPISSTCEST